MQLYTRSHGKQNALLSQYTWMRGSNLKSGFEAICFHIFFSCNHSKPKTWCLTCAIETTEVKPHFSVFLLGFEHHKEYNERDGGKCFHWQRNTQIYKTISSILAMYFSAVSYWQINPTSLHKIGSIEITRLFI